MNIKYALEVTYDNGRTSLYACKTREELDSIREFTIANQPHGWVWTIREFVLGMWYSV